MKKLNEYINEQLINESILLMSLCGAVASHFAIRGLKKVRKVSNGFWNWACGDTKLSVQSQAVESLNENEKNFDKSKVEPAMVESENILEKVIEITKTDAKKKQGFYVFDNLFKETPELKKINKAPYFPNYVIFMDAGSKDNEDQKPNFYGILGFSLKYWTVVAKKGKDEKIKESASKLTKYINIFAVQTEPKYAKQGLFETYLEDMKNAVKEAKMEGLTIKGDNEKLVEIYKKYGFKEIEGLKGYFALTLNKEQNNKDEATL